MTPAALCPECDQPMLPKGRRRKYESDYRHASGCPRGESVVEREAEPRCEGRYPVPGPRTEGFPVTYRCGLPVGHAGEHAAEPAGGQEYKRECDQCHARDAIWLCLICSEHACVDCRGIHEDSHREEAG